MRRYVCALKLLEQSHVVKFSQEAVDVPEEALRMLRMEYGLAFAITGDSVYFWKVGRKVQELLADLEQFTGKYRVGKDHLGYFWEKTKHSKEKT